jgi:hypothetical protein
MLLRVGLVGFKIKLDQLEGARIIAIEGTARLCQTMRRFSLFLSRQERLVGRPVGVVELFVTRLVADNQSPHSPYKRVKNLYRSMYPYRSDQVVLQYCNDIWNRSMLQPDPKEAWRLLSCLVVLSPKRS